VPTNSYIDASRLFLYKTTSNLMGITGDTGAYLRTTGGQVGAAKGYGWLPYDYVLNCLASDWWSMLKAEWVNTCMFGI